MVRSTIVQTNLYNRTFSSGNHRLNSMDHNPVVIKEPAYSSRSEILKLDFIATFEAVDPWGKWWM